MWWKIRRPARGGASAAHEAGLTAQPQAATKATPRVGSKVPTTVASKAVFGEEKDAASASEAVSSSCVRMCSPLQLAYLGDAVYELLVRRELIRRSAGISPPAMLHEETVARVRAGAQAAALARILPRLTPAEQEVVRRARNARPKHSIPAGAEVWEYRYSSGLEALFGFLFLEGQLGRMEEIFRWIQEGDGAPAPAPR